MLKDDLERLIYAARRAGMFEERMNTSRAELSDLQYSTEKLWCVSGKTISRLIKLKEELEDIRKTVREQYEDIEILKQKILKNE